ncbi:histidine utilization repressor [Kaistia dalseonensis]|uniref:Histidine utilization repressor n=1 Tax=Kaistia dalseonensis TaxID=410840 RepID=A0ABU0H0L1_9HYPH|nr:histidine utilization repressor [Kaistia dalseonensis]MCX5493284.1 histidine utilization repressor [Kaistia dalseonensis]MDQ0435841.1 GntR family histidine utilization transcriptional repressor [Kaistia dalseonensis]
MSRTDQGDSAAPERAGTAPLYAGVKQMILGRIQNGDWPPRHRIPSENELVSELGVSRMTVNRALRELSLEGIIVRVQGLGSFVAEGKGQSSIVEVRNIADEIAERGHQHSARIIVLDTLRASPEIAESLDIDVGEPVYHSIIVHLENEIPVQLEDRYVNTGIAPDYIRQDFTQITPNRFLSEVVAWTEAEHEIEAVLPAAWEARLLAMSRTDPCMLIRRRTFVGERVVTAVRLLIPGGRYRLRSRQRPSQG